MKSYFIATLMDLKEPINEAQIMEILERLGGNTHYIPKMPVKIFNILKEALHLKKVGYTKKQIITALQTEFNLSDDYLRKILKKYPF